MDDETMGTDERAGDEIGTKKAAEILNVHQRHVRWYYQNGRLPGRIVYDQAGRPLLLLKRSDVEKFEKPKLGRKPRKPAAKSQRARSRRPRKTSSRRANGRKAERDAGTRRNRPSRQA